MKKILIGIVVAGLVVLAVTAVPALAHNPSNTTEQGATTTDQSTWDTMYNACQDGDWDTMANAAEQYQQETGNPCWDEFDTGTPNDTGTTGNGYVDNTGAPTDTGAAGSGYMGGNGYMTGNGYNTTGTQNDSGTTGYANGFGGMMSW